MNTFKLLLLSTLIAISFQGQCAQHPALTRFKNLTEQFASGNSSYDALKKEALENFQLRDAAVPNDASEFNICPDYKNVQTCCVPDTLKLLKLIASSNFENNINEFKGNKAIVLSPGLSPNLDDPMYNKYRSCIRQNAIKKFEDWAEKLLSQKRIPDAPQDADDDAKKLPSEFKPDEDKQETFKNQVSIEVTRTIVLRSQLCSLCVPPSDWSTIFPGGSLKIKKDSYKKITEVCKKQIKAQKKQTEKIIKLVEVFMKQAVNMKNEMCKRVFWKRTFDNSTWLKAQDPCKGKSDCEDCFEQMPKLLSQKNVPGKGFSKRKKEDDEEEGDLELRRRLRQLADNSVSVSSGNEGIDSYVSVSSDSTYSADGVQSEQFTQSKSMEILKATLSMIIVLLAIIVI